MENLAFRRSAVWLFVFTMDSGNSKTISLPLETGDGKKFDVSLDVTNEEVTVDVSVGMFGDKALPHAFLNAIEQRLVANKQQDDFVGPREPMASENKDQHTFGMIAAN
jgi:hypothetical protein